jgi:hypothetical protein
VQVARDPAPLLLLRRQDLLQQPARDSAARRRSPMSRRNAPKMTASPHGTGEIVSSTGAPAGASQRLELDRLVATPRRRVEEALTRRDGEGGTTVSRKGRPIASSRGPAEGTSAWRFQ